MNADEYISQLRDELDKLQGTSEGTLSNGSINAAETERLYALLHNTKNTADSAGYSLISQICALACGMLQHSEYTDELVLEAVKAHIDALVVNAAHDLSGNGGALGQEMVCELEGLAKVVNA